VDQQTEHRAPWPQGVALAGVETCVRDHHVGRLDFE